MSSTKKILCLALAFVCNFGWAGTRCEKQDLNPEQFAQASKIAIKISHQLNTLNPKVALIARVGSNLEKYGVHYTHAGFVIKDYPGREGQWTVIHLLNECGTTQSSIYKQGLMNFFIDNLYSLEYQIIIPNSQTQAQLYAAFTKNKIKNMHTAHYNMLAYPYSKQYQNSNQWVLEILAAATEGKKFTRAEAQNYLQRTNYHAAIIKLSSVARLGAAMFSETVRFDDHPRKEWQNNSFTTVTVESIVNYLKYCQANIISG